MKNWKRVLSLFLSLCMCFSLLAPAGAVDVTEDESSGVPVTDVTTDSDTEEEKEEDITADPADMPDTDDDIEAAEENAADVLESEGDAEDITDSADEDGAEDADDIEDAEKDAADVPDLDADLAANPGIMLTALDDAVALAATDTWEIWISNKFKDAAQNDDNCYLLYSSRNLYQGGYGINLHRARISGTSTTYWAYCMERTLESTESANSNYTIKTLPTNDPAYQAAKYVIALGYGNNTVDQLNHIFGYNLDGYAWYQATQAAVWTVELVADGTYTSVSDAMNSNRLNIQLTSQHKDSDARNAVAALATAALNIYNNGVSLSIGAATKASENGTSITYTVPVTAQNCYGGYTVTLSGLPSGATVVGSAGITVSGTSVSSTTANGTNTLTITIPKGTSDTSCTVSIKATSYNKNYSTNNAVLFADSNNSSYQDFVVATGEGLSTTSASKSLSLAVPSVPTASITVIKRDAETDKPLEGAVFRLYTNNGSDYVATDITATTDGNGKAVFSGLMTTDTYNGQFQVREDSAPAGYELDSAFLATCRITSSAYAYRASDISYFSGTMWETGGGTVTGTVNGETKNLLTATQNGSVFDFTVYAYDYPINTPQPVSGSITVSKRDAVNASPLAGTAQFRLYEWNGSAYVATSTIATADQNGAAVFNPLIANDTNNGKFQIREVKAPNGYQLDENFYANVDITNGEYEYASSFVSSKGTLDTGKTANGKIHNVDRVLATVTSSDAGYNFVLYAYDQPQTGSIAVSKRDANSNATLEGAMFGLYEWNGSAYANTGLTATTNASGIATFSNLAYSAINEGKYQVKEISAPKDYELDENFIANVNMVTGAYEYKSSLVSKSGTITSGATVTGTVNGETRNLVSAKTGTGYDFTVYAFDKQEPQFTFESLTVSKILSQDGDEITYLSGATFTLQEKKADGTWADCIELAEDPDIFPGVFQLPTYEDGSLIFTPEFGTVYRVVEAAAPDGVLNSGWISDEFSWEPNNMVEFSFTAEDEIPTGAFQLKKTDAETGLPLSGVTFTVTAAEDIGHMLNGTKTVVYAKGAKIADLTTDENGTAGLDGLYYGTYTITETATVEDYLFDETVFTAVVGAPSDYAATNTYPVSSAIGVTTYTGIATVTDYEEYHVAEYGKYVKDNSGYVVRYNKTADGSYTQAADGKYAKVEYASVTNQPLHPDMAVAKLTDRTTDSEGGVVGFNADTGRYTEDKIPGTYYNDQTVTFTLTATNTGDVDLYNLYMVDVMSADIWTVVQQPADVTFRAVNGSELVTGSTVTTTMGNTATITNVIYDDATRTYTIYFDKLLVNDSVSVLMTFTLFNNDGVSKNALPNDVYLYAEYLSNGTSGTLKDVPGGGEDDYDCHDKDAINVVSVGSISIHKTDDTGKDMAGVVFQLTDSDGNAVKFVLQDGVYNATVVADNGDWVSAADSGLSVTTNLVTDSMGMIELEGLPFGTYTLTEIKTTEGHALLGESITVTLPYAVEGDEDTSTDQVYYADGTNYYLHLDLDISNAVTIRLPSTGGVSADLWLTTLGIAMVGLVVAALIIPARKRKRQEGRE